MKWWLCESVGRRADKMEERISDLEDRDLEMVQVEKERLLESEETLWELSDSI